MRCGGLGEGKNPSDLYVDLPAHDVIDQLHERTDCRLGALREPGRDVVTHDRVGMRDEPRSFQGGGLSARGAVDATPRSFLPLTLSLSYILPHGDLPHGLPHESPGPLAESADAADLKSAAREGVRVRPPKGPQVIRFE